MDIRVGISGWRYAGWRGTFYPKQLRHADELAYASRCFDTLELNGSFYGLLRPERYETFYRETPPEFCFAVKGSRYITHMKRLREVEKPLANFFASGVLILEEKLGPVLWQLPPNMSFDPERLEAFLSLLPHTTGEAAALARRHDARVAGFAYARVREDRVLRHALEVRNASFLVPELVRILRRHRVALVFSDSPGAWPYTEDVTSDFVYLRLHGAEELYASGYGRAALEWWARRITSWARGGEPRDARRIPGAPAARARRSRRAFVYFDNDAKVHAPFDAHVLMEILTSAS